MTTIRHQAATPSSSSDAQGRDGAEHTARAGDGADRHRPDLVPVLAFLRLEIDQSAMALGDLANRLSKALCALASASVQESCHTDIADAAIALQSEDRIQQRLCDMAAVLALLERAVADGQPETGPDLDKTIIDTLRLEEMRHAFAAAAGMTNAFHLTQDEADKPSVGDIDLF